MKLFTTIFNITVAIFMLTLVSITAYERYYKKDNTKTYEKLRKPVESIDFPECKDGKKVS